MRKVLTTSLFFITGIFILLAAEDKFFMMKTYVARLETNGNIHIDCMGYKTVRIPIERYNEKRKKQNRRIWPPYSSFNPTINVSDNHENKTVTIESSMPGIVESFRKTITLRPDSVLIELETAPAREASFCSSGIELYPKVFSGAEYKALKKTGEVSGKMPSDIPEKHKFVMTGLNKITEMTFTGTKVGTIKFNFLNFPRGLSDLRVLKWSKMYNFHFLKKITSGKVFKYKAEISISSERKAESTQKTKASEPAKILFKLDFDNDFTAQATGDGRPQNKNLPQSGKGIKGKAASFSAGKVLQYLEKENIDKTKGALSFWVKADKIVDPYYEKNPARTLFTESGKAKAGSNAMKLWKSTWGGLRFDIRDKSNTYWGIYDIYSWRPGSWHHVVLNWKNGKGVEIYTDGVLCQTADVKKQKRGLLPLKWHPIPAESFFLGAENKKGNNPWLGMLDEFMIFNRPLTPSEVYEEYKKLSNNKLKVFTRDQYLFARENSKCVIVLENISAGKIKITPEFSLKKLSEKTIFTRKYEEITLAPEKRKKLKLSLPLSKPGNYILTVRNAGETHDIPLKALSSTKDKVAPGKLKLKRLKTISAVKPPEGSFVAHGKDTVVDSSIGKYRETGPKRHERFVISFDVPKTDAPYMAEITWPDNAKRSMEILFLCQKGKESYQAPGGIFAGNAFFPSGKMKIYKVVFWPKTKKSAFMFMCLENGYPAAVKDIKIYKIESGLPKAKIKPFKGTVPSRNIGIFYEDPVIPMCFGAGSLFPGFEKSVDRLLDYMCWFGQNILIYPIVWYHGPLYGSDAEPTVANRSVRMHPDNFPAYILKRLEARKMKFNGIININRLESLDNITVTDEHEVFNGKETIANMRCDNHLQLSTPWNCAETRYNNLDPKVQKTIKGIVAEILERFGDSPAFTGLMLFAKRKGLFALGTLKAGYNDINLSRFQKDTGIKIPCYDKTDTYRFTKSYEWLMGNARDSWINWRCEMMHKFYKEIADMLTAKRKDLKLSVFCGITREQQLNDCGEYLNPAFSPYEKLKETGIDISLFEHDKNIEICSVDRTNSMQHWRLRHGPLIGIEAFRAYGLIPELTAPLRKLPQASTVLFDAYFEDAIGRSRPMKSLKEALPGTSEKAWRCSAVNPNTFYALENYVAALNNFDALSITKGGFSVGTLGIENWIRAFAEAYRTLPAVKFDNVKNLTDPIRVRQKTINGKNYIYVLNRLPVEMKFNLKFSKEGSVFSLTEDKKIKITEIILPPYSLKTFTTAPEVKVVSGKTEIPEEFIKKMLKRFELAEKSYSTLVADGVPMLNYKRFLDYARKCLAEKKYARLYILLYESWTTDMNKLLRDKNLQEFLKTEKNYLKKQNRKRYSILPMTKDKININGILDEKAWEQALIIKDFADFLKYKGKLLAKPASMNTEVRLLSNGKMIFIGVICYENDTSKIIVKRGLRDGALWANDYSLEFFLKDLKTTKGKFGQFLVNAGSSKTDIFGGGAGREWNIEWKAVSRIIPEKGWVCEIAVPLEEITESPSGKILFNIGRHRGTNPSSGLSLTEENGWFCEEFWMELQQKGTK